MTDKKSKGATEDGLPLNLNKYSPMEDDPAEGPRYDEPAEPSPTPTSSKEPGFVPGQTDEKSARNVEKG